MKKITIYGSLGILIICSFGIALTAMIPDSVTGLGSPLANIKTDPVTGERYLGPWTEEQISQLKQLPRKDYKRKMEGMKYAPEAKLEVINLFESYTRKWLPKWHPFHKATFSVQISEQDNADRE